MKYRNKLLNIILIISLIYSSIVIPFSNVKATGIQAKLSSSAPDSLAFRTAPSTKNSDIIDAISKNELFYILDENKISGEGCSSGYYKLLYKNQEGYACSKYITTDLSDPYDRPWNTPKKAIIGGAKFISSGYISKGQFTSYLKKFNVNPNGAYSMYNHIYQANIEAPKSEAATSFKSYCEYSKTQGKCTNQAIDLPFNFSIPVFEQMAESYLHPTGWKANLGTTDQTDTAFEEMIKDFPDSYKPYLRQMHLEHSSWTFTPMKTGVTIEEAAEVVKTTGSINSTNTKLTELDANGNPIPTNEKNWYRPNSEVTRFYLDPRNFLNETYVFMFENLSYIEIDESIIQGVLNNNELIKGMDTIDNQSYSSIFKEAGSVANVNPVYLASLSVHEVGSQTLLVTGQEFVYENVTYSGLFNFYNIGASSSASNPLRAGLKYASGGLCTICATYTQEQNQGSSENNQSQEQPKYNKQDSVNNIGAVLKGDYISGFNIGTSISSLKAKDGNIIYSSDDIIKTGQKLTFADGTSSQVVVYGDASGDGKVNSADLLVIKQHLLGSHVLSNEYLEAANVLRNGKINSANLLRIKQYLLGTANLEQN